ncbi:MAG TPA: GGDEF domain-containing protein, partial [Bradyrhizobium sp.]|nr:GGDEF domain-containing protein [Bradyrhizobium sp.]
MSQQGPLLLVSDRARPALTAALKTAQLSPTIETRWSEAAQAVGRLQPAAVLAVMTEAKASDIASFAAHVAASKPYLPLIAFDPAATLPDNAIPFAPEGDNFDRLIARLRAMQRIRTLHATVLRRIDE